MEKIKKTARLLIFTFLVACSGYSQNAQIVLTNGSAAVDGVALFKGVRLPLEDVGTVTLKKGGFIVVFDDDRKLQIGSKTQDEKWTRAAMLAKLAKQPMEKVATYNMVTFSKSVKKSYRPIRMEQKSEGTSLAATDGLNPDGTRKKNARSGEFFFPDDSTVVLGPSVTLEWDTKKNVLSPRLFVVHKSSGDTIFSKADAPLSGMQTVSLARPGDYEWSLMSGAGRKVKITRRFSKADDKQGALIRQEQSAFKKSISTFDPDVQAVLLEDYNSKILE